MPPLTVSTSKFSRESGLPLRQVQTLTDAKVFLPDIGSESPGRGSSRQYSYSELELAKLLGAISYKRMSAKEAAALVDTMRPIVEVPVVHGVRSLEQALQLRRYAKAVNVDKSMPKALQKQAAKTMKDLAPRWGDTEITDATAEVVEAWAMLELAKRRQADVTMLLQREKSGRWTYRFIAAPLLPSLEFLDTLSEETKNEAKRAQAATNANDRSLGGYWINLTELFSNPKD